MFAMREIPSSSRIHSVGYDPTQQVLVVRFKDRTGTPDAKVRNYRDVPPDVARGFDTAAFAERMRAAKDRPALDALGKELQAANVGEEVSSPLEDLFLELLEALPAAPAPAPATRRTATRTTTAE